VRSTAVNADLFASQAIASESKALEFIGNILKSSTEHPMIATDLEGVILAWREGARRLYGYEAVEIIGRPKAVLHAQEDILAGLPQTRRGAQG
jgi:PAS domain-containing protein